MRHGLPSPPDVILVWVQACTCQCFTRAGMELKHEQQGHGHRFPVHSCLVFAVVNASFAKLHGPDAASICGSSGVKWHYEQLCVDRSNNDSASQTSKTNAIRQRDLQTGARCNDSRMIGESKSCWRDPMKVYTTNFTTKLYTFV